MSSASLSVNCVLSSRCQSIGAVGNVLSSLAASQMISLRHCVLYMYTSVSQGTLCSAAAVGQTVSCKLCILGSICQSIPLERSEGCSVNTH